MLYDSIDDIMKITGVFEMENLAEYLNNGVETIVRQALKASLKNPLESAFILKFMSAQQKASKRRLQAEKEGTHVPPFLIASISSQCNLFCAGCYARANNSISNDVCNQQLGDAEWERIFGEAEEMGIAFMLLAGGEPLMRRNVIGAAARFNSIVFPIFTNGTMIDDGYIRLLNKNRNLVPMLSLEGGREQTDKRRGEGVYGKLTEVISKLSKKGILYGVSITVTKQNLTGVTDEKFIKDLYDDGCKVVVFVEYVPVTDNTGTSAPDSADRMILSERQDMLRAVFEDMLIVAFPGDEEEFGGCLAAGRGFFHINPMGGAEPCPFSPYSDTSLKNCSLQDALKSPLFRKLEMGGLLAGEHLGGCALYGREAEIRELLNA
jgi:MoaA/NifB/PqqE/SkfB family radical SAM enzyme